MADTPVASSSQTAIDSLISQIASGLSEHASDPIGWLERFIESVKRRESASILSSSQADAPYAGGSAPVALVVDCGTGETKILLYKITDGVVDVDEKRLAWIAESDRLERLLSARASDMPAAIAAAMGKPYDWVMSKLEAGYFWKLAILPNEAARLADWEGCIRSAQIAYPEVSSKIAKWRDALKTSSLSEIEAGIGAGLTFRAIKNRGRDDPRYIDLQKLIDDPDPELWKIRGFLFNVVGVNELFSGTGFTFDEHGTPQSTEYLIPNRRLGEIPGCEIV
ncbi:MAG: hypothetical protein AAFY15_09590, partial [Cyanobacteria bacterium J06648_11]